MKGTCARLAEISLSQDTTVNVGLLSFRPKLADEATTQLKQAYPTHGECGIRPTHTVDADDIQPVASDRV